MLYYPGTHLSDVLLRDLRVIDTHPVLFEFGAKAKACYSGGRRPLLYLVLNGSLSFHVDDPASALTLHTGDSALFFYGDRHLIGEIKSKIVQELKFPENAKDRPEEPAVFRIGNEPIHATVLGCMIDLAYISPATLAIRPAPKIWPMYASAGEEDGRALTGDPEQWLHALHGPGAIAFVNMLIGLHLVHSIRDMYKKVWRNRIMDIHAPATRWLGAAIRTIHTQPDRPWTVARLAHDVGLSRSQFAELFKQHIGVPPLSYLTGVRMARAAELLEFSTVSITDVGRRVGYPVQKSFARAFASFHGASPKEFVRRKSGQLK